jgi:serine/threonine protein kinase
MDFDHRRSASEPQNTFEFEAAYIERRRSAPLEPLMHDEDAEFIFSQWADAVERDGSDVGHPFQDVLAAHPACADELRKMHADWLHFAPLLAQVVPGMLMSLDGAPLPSEEADEAPPVTSELLDRLGIQVPDASRYRFRGVLGQGGGGVVLRVWDHKLQRPLAMKIVLGRAERGLPPPRTARETPPVDAAALTRFVDEARIASQLDHPSIVPVHELGTDASGRAYFTMRLVRGRDLHQILEARRTGAPEWTETRLLGLLAKACEAIAYAHERGVVHRDLKPSNIMVGRHGEVHVMDWGLARVHSPTNSATTPAAPDSGRRTPQRSEVRTLRRTEREATPGSPLLTGAGAALGTPAYMSPEQARGDNAIVDARADVYALGAILYEVLGGTPPFIPQGANIDAGLVYLRLLEGPPRPLRELAPRAPEQLLAIVERAMAREASARYPDVRALEADLRAFLERRVVKAYETGPWAETRQWMLRNRGLVAALATGILMLVAGLVTTENLRRDAVENQRLFEKASIAEAANATSAKAAEAKARRAEYRSAILAADMALRAEEPEAFRDIMDAIPVEQRHFEWGYLDAHSDNSDVAIDLPGEKIRAAALSSDGRLVAAVLESGAVQIIEASSGDRVAAFPFAWPDDHSPGLVSFLPGDDEVLLRGNDGWSVHDWRSGKMQRSEWKTEAPSWRGTVDQQGRQLATVYHDSKTVLLWDWRAGVEIGHLEGHTAPIRHGAFDRTGEFLATLSNAECIVWDLKLQIESLRIGTAIAEGGIEDLQVQFTHDASRVLLIADHGEKAGVVAWNRKDGRREWEICLRSGDERENVDSVELASTAPVGVIRYGNGAVALWSAETGSLLWSSNLPEGFFALDPAVSSNGRLVAVSQEIGVVSVIETNSGVEAFRLTDLPGKPECITFDRGGAALGGCLRGGRHSNTRPDR